jgi:SAM-dependent methyltransferase
MTTAPASTASDIQREHYSKTAAAYDDVLGRSPEHELALYFLLGIIESIQADSILDVGAGTGRAIKFIRNFKPDLRLCGIEPVEELRNVAYASGVPREMVVSGDGCNLPFPDASFDIVTEFGVLHHVECPELIVGEMLRVARYGILISDTNNLGQGSLSSRLIKNAMYWSGLWRSWNLLRTKGKGYMIEPHDGLWYYYTPFLHWRELTRRCHSVHLLNTRVASITHWLSASHVAIFAAKAEIVSRNAFYEHLR